jgi:hypothetical protein|tara:strand:- start:1380 stop:1913 length:534 start_codon:yes stop_codon:yes gene_type:complete
MNLNQKLKDIQVQFKAKKTRFNSFGKYYFRSAEDILEAIKPHLTKHNVTVIVNEDFDIGEFGPIIKTTATITDGTDSISAAAVVGVDLAQKGMQVPQQFGSASSYGKKYALGNLFLIDDTQDSDATNSHGKASKAFLKAGTDSFNKAVDYVKAGGKVDSIKKKYSMSSEIEAQLKSI